MNIGLGFGIGFKFIDISLLDIRILLILEVLLSRFQIRFSKFHILIVLLPLKMLPYIANTKPNSAIENNIDQFIGEGLLKNEV